MIGRLRGVLVHKQPPQLLVEVHGVGYEVEAPMSTFYDLPAVGSEVILYTHLVVREDAQVLCGFIRDRDRTLFRHLIRVNGVGPRLALAILSGISADAFVRCVQERDGATLTRLPGVGKKTAERLLIEMVDRLGEWTQPLSGQSADRGGAPAPAGPVEDAVSALIALGYKPQEASRMVRAVDTAELPSEEIIRRALQTVLKA